MKFNGFRDTGILTPEERARELYEARPRRRLTAPRDYQYDEPIEMLDIGPPHVPDPRSPFIFPVGPVNIHDNQKFIGGSATSRDPGTLRIPVVPWSEADVIMNNHRRVMAGLHTYSRPRLGSSNYSPEDSGSLIALTMDGEVVNSTSFDPVGYTRNGEDVFEAHRTVFQFPQEMDIGSASREFMEVVNSEKQSFNDESPMLKLSQHIYQALYINDLQDRARFYVGFGKNQEAMGYIPRVLRGGTEGQFIVVKMAEAKRPAYNEIRYIALMIARRFNQYIIQYGAEDTETMSVDISSVSIEQYLTEGDYNPIIRAGPTTEMMTSLMEDGQDPILRTEYTKLKKYLGVTRVLTSPSTYKNCMITAVILALQDRRYEDLSAAERRKLSNKAAGIKSRLNIEGSGGFWDMIKALSGVKLNRVAGGPYKVAFTTVGGHELAVLLSPGVKPRARCKRVVIFGGHAMAVVSKGEDIVEEATPMMKKPTKTPKEYTLGVWDMETTADGVKPYMIGYMFRGGACRQIHGLDCVDEFLQVLADKVPKGNTLMYAHNGGKFDVVLIMDKLRDCSFLKIVGMLQRNGRFLKLRVKVLTREDVYIDFVDSYMLVPTSLDKACKMYGVENPKLGGVFHDRITSENFAEEIISQNLEAYLHNDVKGLMQVLEAFDQNTYDIVGFRPIASGMLTSSAIPKHMFLNKYLNDDELLRPWLLPTKTDVYIRKSYHAGRCDVFYRGLWEGPLNYIDFVSMYPSVMVNEDLPVGPPTFHESLDNIDDFWGFLRIMVRGGNDEMNGIRVKTHEGGLIAPKFNDWTETTIFSEELRGILEMNDFFNYEIRYIDGYSFNHTKFLRQITLDFFEEKKRAKGNDVQYNLAKMRLNSIYGHFGFKVWNTTLKLITKWSEFQSYLETGHVLSTDGMFAEVREKQDSNIRSVAVSSAITAWSHIKLLKYMVGIKKAGFNVLYCDTDSVVTNMPAPSIEAYEVTGEELGMMNYEHDFIHSGVFLAPKVYALTYTDINEKTMALEHGEHVRVKGVPQGKYTDRRETSESVIFEGYRIPGGDVQMGFDDIKALLTKHISVTTTRFFGGKRRMLRDGLIRREHTVTVSGRLVKGNMSDSGWVIPLQGSGEIYQ